MEQGWCRWQPWEAGLVAGYCKGANHGSALAAQPLRGEELACGLGRLLSDSLARSSDDARTWEPPPGTLHILVREWVRRSTSPAWVVASHDQNLETCIRKCPSAAPDQELTFSSNLINLNLISSEAGLLASPSNPIIVGHDAHVVMPIAPCSEAIGWTQSLQSRHASSC